MRYRTLAFVLISLTFAASAGTATAADRLTPVVMSVISPPVPVRGTDGLIYLQYELRLTNLWRTAFTIDRIEVLDPRGRVVSDISGDVVPTRLRVLDRGRSAVISPGQTGIALLFPTFRTSREVPRSLSHRLTLRPVSADVFVGPRIVETGEVVRVDRRPPVVVGPPMRGTGWVATGSCCLQGHSGAALPIKGRLFLSQRYAIDWTQINAQGRAVTGDPAVNASWVGYGKELLAVRDGTVVSALDGLPDRTPGALPPDTTLANVLGNHVVLDLGRGYFALYAHMKPGSVRVRPGQRVRRGQVLGLLGNSGNSSSPHLHFQVMQGRSPLASDPFPYVFDSLVVRGKLPAQTTDEEFERGVFPEPIKQGRQRRVLPMHGWVVDFPPLRGR